MDLSELSLSVALSRENLQTEDPERFTLYASLIRVGLSTSFGAFAVFLIVLILFVPSMTSSPIGQTGTTVFGLLSSAISYKIYRAIKISNSTVLTAGRKAVGPDSLWRKSTRTTARRAGTSLVALLSAPTAVYLGFRALDFVLSSTASYQEGMFSTLGEPIKLLLVIAVFAFDLGILTISLGCMLVFGSLLTPLRSAIMRGYRYLRLQVILVTYRNLERITGLSPLAEPEKICERCFSSSFKVREDTDRLSEYELACSRCKRPVAEVNEYEEYKHGENAWKDVHATEGPVSVQD